MYKLLSIVVGYAMAESTPVSSWDYKKHGDDWKDISNIPNNSCGGRNQSPIDLTMSL
jgi:carbonic anhydrase